MEINAFTPDLLKIAPYHGHLIGLLVKWINTTPMNVKSYFRRSPGKPALQKLANMAAVLLKEKFESREIFDYSDIQSLLHRFRVAADDPKDVSHLEGRKFLKSGLEKLRQRMLDRAVSIQTKPSLNLLK